jgi:hypothetical protein
MFNSWLWRINKELKQLVLLGAASICWAVWRHRNDIVFEWKNVTNVLQVVDSGYTSVLGLCYRSLFLGVGYGYMWIRLWLHVNNWSKLLGFYFPRHIGSDLVFRLITTKYLEVSLGLGCMHPARCRSQGFCIKRVVTRDNLNSIKFPLLKKEEKIRLCTENVSGAVQDRRYRCWKCLW